MYFVVSCLRSRRRFFAFADEGFFLRFANSEKAMSRPPKCRPEDVQDRDFQIKNDNHAVLLIGVERLAKHLLDNVPEARPYLFESTFQDPRAMENKLTSR